MFIVCENCESARPRDLFYEYEYRDQLRAWCRDCVSAIGAKNWPLTKKAGSAIIIDINEHKRKDLKNGEHKRLQKNDGTNYQDD